MKNLFLGITSRMVMSISAILLIASCSSVFISPGKAWYMTIFGLMFLPLLLLNLFFLILALLRKSRSFIIPVLALVPAFFIAGRYFQISGSPSKGSADTIKIMTYNVGHFILGEDTFPRGAECSDSVYAFMLRNDPDIICMQEFYMDAKNVAQIKRRLSKRFKGYNVECYMNVRRGMADGNVIISRFPILDKGGVNFEHSANRAMYADFNIHGTMLRVYNCHFQSYGISLTTMAKRLRDEDEMRKTGGRIRQSIRQRSDQVEQVLEHIETGPKDAVIVGDFNDTPLSHTYYKMSMGRKDSFVEKGRGFDATYSSLQPLLRIDYVLFPKRFKAVSHEVVHVPYSDHYPVIAEIDLG